MSNPTRSTLSESTESSTDGPSDAELIERARRGDDAAFRQLVVRYEPVVAGTVIGMLGAGPEAEDVGQETFIRFYRALGQFRGEAKLSTYLTRIAINLSLNAIKRRKRQRQRYVSRDETLAYTPEASVELRDAMADQIDGAVIDEALQALTPPFRSVVVLRLVDGYSTRETAELLDVPIGTVLSRLARAQRKLRTLLAPYFSDDRS